MNTVLQLIKLFPAILQMILEIEAAFKSTQTPVTGATKKALLISGVQSAGAPQDVVDGVSKMVDSTVTALNNSGVFKKGN